MPWLNQLSNPVKHFPKNCTQNVRKLPIQAQGICGQLQCRKSGKVAKTPQQKCPRGQIKGNFVREVSELNAQVRHACMGNLHTFLPSFFDFCIPRPDPNAL